MATGSLLITLAIVGVPCAIAALLARRWQLRFVPAWLASLSWGLALVVAYYLMMTAWPPIPWTAASVEAEPWESVVFPVGCLSLLWPIVSMKRNDREDGVAEPPAGGAHGWPLDPTGRLLAALIVSAWPLLAALCTTERFAAYFVGNTPWTLAALVAVGINWLAIDGLERRGAGRWSLWVLVGQALTVAALIMTCYGRFGEWATAAGLTLAVVATARLMVSDPQANWASSLAVPALALSSVLIMHVREYRSAPLPLWLPAFPFLLPAFVGALDYACLQRLHPWVRVICAAVLTAAIGTLTIASVLAFNDGSEDW